MATPDNKGNWELSSSFCPDKGRMHFSIQAVASAMQESLHRTG